MIVIDGWSTGVAFCMSVFRAASVRTARNYGSPVVRHLVRYGQAHWTNEARAPPGRTCFVGFGVLKSLECRWTLPDLLGLNEKCHR